MDKKTENLDKVAPKVKETKAEATVADEIWNEIKDKKVDMFALPSQSVHQYCKPVTIEPSKCFLLSKVSAFLPALESCLGAAYDVSRSDKYIVVEKVKSKV